MACEVRLVCCLYCMGLVSFMGLSVFMGFVCMFEKVGTES